MTLADLSPTAIVQFRREVHTSTPTQRARFRGLVRRQVLDCAGCELHRRQPDGHQPTPYAGPVTAAFTVIGEAPGPQEVEKGRPFVGPAGKLLRSMMGRADIDPDDDVLWANSVSCLPIDVGSEKWRAPNEAESMACRTNMFAQIEACYSPFVLLVGAKAFNAFRGDLSITNHHGRVFVWLETYIVMGIIHPGAVNRGAKHFAKLIRADLEKWHEVVFGGDDPLNHLSEECVRCGQQGQEWDRDGVPYCTEHWKKWGKTWMQERKKWDNARVEQLTF